jgi:hypothetical protein
MIELDQDSPRSNRSRGFSPPAAVAILVGVTALSVVGSLGLGMAVFPQPEGNAASAQPMSYPDDVLVNPAPATPAAPAPAAPAVDTPAAAPVEAASERPAARPAPRVRSPRPNPTPAAAAPETRQASRDDLGLESGDPLGPIQFDRIEG